MASTQSARKTPSMTTSFSTWANTSDMIMVRSLLFSRGIERGRYSICVFPCANRLGYDFRRGQARECVVQRFVVLGQIRHGPVVHEPPLVDQNHAAGHRLDFLEDVCRQQDGLLFAQPPHSSP